MHFSLRSQFCSEMYSCFKGTYGEYKTYYTYFRVTFSFNVLVDSRSLSSHLSHQHERLLDRSLSTVQQLDNSGLVTRHTCRRGKHVFFFLFIFNNLENLCDKHKICSPTVGAAVDCSQTGILFLQNLQVAQHFDLEVNKHRCS